MDFVINNYDTLQLYLASTSQHEVYWEKHEISFPILNADSHLPLAFELVDFDFDGDFDLASDGRRFWWNTGNNQTPVWVQDDSVLTGLELGFNLSFVDHDNDGDWDVAGDLYPGALAQFYQNITGGRRPQWMSDSSKIAYGGMGFIFNPQYCDVDRDGDFDMFCATPVPVDPAGCNRLLLFRNLGTLDTPVWNEQSLSHTWCGYYPSYGRPGYQVVDFDGDGDYDLLTRELQRRFAFIKNFGSADSLHLDFDRIELIGPVSAESQAIPVLFDHEYDGALDLIVSEDFEYDFVFNRYHEGRVISFANQGGRFEIGASQNNWFENPYPLRLYNFANHFHFNFSDFDRDGDRDFLFSYYKVSVRDTVTGSRVIYFRNDGSPAQPNWIADSLIFAPFDLSPQRFWAPQLIDLDNDGDDDLFMKRGRQFVFYENITTDSVLAWREQPGFMQGITNSVHYLATFADLTRDGLADLIFGNDDGTLEFYENIGTVRAPAWQLVAEAFAQLDFGEYAAPTFGDFDQDGRLDLFAGNRNGELFFLRNESSVAVQEKKLEIPKAFSLGQNYPNPFNPETKIVFFVPPNARQQRVVIKIFDLTGRLVRVLFDREVAPGRYEVMWDGKDAHNNELASGTYVYRLEAGNIAITKKMSLIH
ncbi:VCBS repeat-containing protein [candidate division KSB1 bacterium]|nr:FG-GAP-like repeat-containing protein [bacterium]NUM67694.1 VCBS repeat-containing protein [candidate division KSB1 bacterium]